MLHVHQLVNTSITKRHWSTQEIITLVVEFVTSDPILNTVIQFTFNSMTINVTVLMEVRQLTESSITQRQWYAQENVALVQFL